jgi:hypothetical protein
LDNKETDKLSFRITQSDILKIETEAKERLNVVLAETELDCIEEENTEGVLIGK